MKRTHLTMILIIIFLWGIGIAAIFAAEYVPQIGNDNPKILGKFPLPKEFSSAGDMSIQYIGGKTYLWIAGTERLTDKDGKRSWKKRITIFDVSNPSKPKPATIYETPDFSSRMGFSGKYAYVLYTISAKSREALKKMKKHYGFYIYDVSDPLKPVMVKKTDGMFSSFPKFYIEENTKTMWVFEGIPSAGGIIDHTVVSKVDINDPENPKVTPMKIKDFDGKELSFSDGYIENMEIRDNFFYLLTRRKIYVAANINNDTLQILAQEKGVMPYFNAISLAPPYMSRDEIFLIVTGMYLRYFYPGEENPNPGRYSSQSALIPLVRFDEDFGNGTLGSWGGAVRLPLDVRFIQSSGQLVYIVGSDIQKEEPDYYQMGQVVYPNAKILVVDLSRIDDPKFSGILEFDGSFTDCLIKGNTAYVLCFKTTGQSKDYKRQFTLYSVELPVKEGLFKQHQASSVEEIYGLKEPEIVPKSIDIFLREEIGKPTGALTSANFKGITALSFEEMKITDLNGIELCYDLEELKLGVNNITDITPLAGLKKLKVLKLGNNKIEDIGPLSNLTKLTELDLTNNKIKDITQILSLPNLSKLNLSRNYEADLSPISKMISLTELRLGYNNIFRPPSLANLKNLKVLRFVSNDIYYMDFIADLPSGLEELNLYGNNINDISSLTRLTGLKRLTLVGNSIMDISSLANLTQLEELDISDNNKIQDFSSISHLIKLKKLGLSELNIGDISFLKNLTGLEDLNISHINPSMFPNKVSDLEPLANLRKLQVLNAGENKIKNIKPLAGLSELVTLILNKNEIESTDALKSLKKLERVNLSENKIEDISQLSGLKNLVDIDVFKNEIKDVTSLLDKLSPYCTITVGGNKIPKEQIDKLRKIVVVLPDEKESMSLSNLITIASCEINFQKDKGRFTSDIKELVTSGFLVHPGNIETLTLDSILSNYKVDLFTADEKSFTIIIAPEKEGKGRIFAVTEKGVVLEWLGNGKPDLTKINFDSSDWKSWPPNCRFSVLSCGTGG